MSQDNVINSPWPEVEVALREKRRELIISNRHGMDPQIYRLTQLNFLDISKCTLTDVSDDLGRLNELTKLSLHHNAISKLPESLGGLILLRFLDLSFNNISSLPPTIFDRLSSLETLVMDSNNLTVLPSLRGLINLHHLSVSNNALSCLPESLVCCTKLMTIDVSGNELTDLPNDIDWENLANLHRFNLSRNQLSGAPYALAECKKLRDLQLQENPLKDSRLRKLAASTRPGPALINYLVKEARGHSKNQKNSPKLVNTTPHRNTGHQSVGPSICQDLIVSPAFGDELYTVVIVKPREVQKSLRPRLLACIVRGICLGDEGVLGDFVRFQTKLHSGLGEQRRLATFSTHDLKHLNLPLQFSLQPVDDIYINPLNMKKQLTGRQLLTHLQFEAESERKRRKLTTFSGLMRYLELISPLLGPGREALSAAFNGSIQPLPVTTDASGNTLSLHPITGCNQTRLTKETTEILIEVAGMTDEVCKNIIRALLAWLLRYARPKEEEHITEGLPRPLIITPLAIVNSETGDQFAKYPTTVDLIDLPLIDAEVN